MAKSDADKLAAIKIVLECIDVNASDLDETQRLSGTIYVLACLSERLGNGQIPADVKEVISQKPDQLSKNIYAFIKANTR
jgi:hypothetical protein